PMPSDAAALDSVERRFFALAPLVAACPRYLRDYVRLSGRLREAIKWQSRRWDVAGDGARVRLYRSLYGFRGAVEEAMLQHPDTSLSLLEGRREPSATPAATVHGVEIHSGDILVSRGGYPTSALIARGNDYPGNFSHVGLVHVDGVSHVASVIEAHIERGVAEWRDAGALMQDHIDNAAIDAMLEGAEAGDALFYPWYELPLARLAKAYSWLLGGFGGQGPVPQGMSARAALRNRAFSDRQRWVAARVAEAAARFTRQQGYPPPYWVLLDLSRTATEALRGAPRTAHL